MEFDREVDAFIQLAQKHGLRMLMVGGGAVNFHGYKRHSADVDFWVELSPENLARLKKVLMEMGYGMDDFPAEVKEGKQNISLKISPEQEIELITNFNPGKSFDEAWNGSEVTTLKNPKNPSYRVLSYPDLIQSKQRAARPKDLLDIQELKRVRKQG